MGSKTKIVVLHMKEIVYTVVFAVLAIMLIFLLLFMFLPSANKKNSADLPKYNPGIYTSTLSLNNTNLEVEVNVDESHINSIRFSNLDESVTTMFPLIQPAMEDIADQICENQSLSDISLSQETPYTSQVIINAITDALAKAEAN